MTDQMKPSSLPANQPNQPKPVVKTEATVHPIQTKPTLSTTVLPPAPKEFENKIPDGSLDINLVRPGFGPLEGSPKENDPTVLFNPNNPLSPVTRPLNPSNPANPPQTQSEKPASEVRMFNELNAPAVKSLSKSEEDRKAKLADSFKKLGDILNEFGGESSIPPGHAYWGMVNEHRALANP